MRKCLYCLCLRNNVMNDETAQMLLEKPKEEVEVLSPSAPALEDVEGDCAPNAPQDFGHLGKEVCLMEPHGVLRAQLQDMDIEDKGQGNKEEQGGEREEALHESYDPDLERDLGAPSLTSASAMKQFTEAQLASLFPNEELESLPSRLEFFLRLSFDGGALERSKLGELLRSYHRCCQALQEDEAVADRHLLHSESLRQNLWRLDEETVTETGDCQVGLFYTSIQGNVFCCTPV